MSIWSKYINKFNRTSNTDGPNSKLLNNPHVFTYRYSPLYLGREGVITLKNGTREIYIHYSERDGLAWKLKQLTPYKILFSYDDGAYYVNDSTETQYTELIARLNLLKAKAHSQDFTQSYSQLEMITSDFLSD